MAELGLLGFLNPIERVFSKFSTTLDQMRLTIHNQTMMEFRLNDKHLKIVNLLRRNCTSDYFLLCTGNNELRKGSCDNSSCLFYSTRCEQFIKTFILHQVENIWYKD